MAASTLVLAAGAAAGGGARAADAQPRYPGPAAVKRAALKDVRRRLRLAVAPPQSHRVAKAPKAAHLDGAAFLPISPNSLDRHRIWRVPGSPRDALDWVKAHAPDGLPVKLESGSGAPQHIVVDTIGFEWGELPGIAVGRSLIFVAKRADGHTYLWADSQAVWITPHPAGAVIPASARSVDVTLKKARGPVERKKIDAPAKVREAAVLIARLPAAQPGQYECGPGLESDFEEVTMAFRDGSGAIVAEVEQHTVGSWCGVLELRVGGERQPLLEAGLETLEEVPGLIP